MKLLKGLSTICMALLNMMAHIHRLSATTEISRQLASLHRLVAYIFYQFIS